jgi:hypothetical protein
MNIVKISVLSCFFFFLAFAVNADTDQANLVRLPPSSILCIDDDATGFNWKNKKWVQINFKAGDRYIARKIEVEKYLKREDRSKNKLLLCDDPQVVDLTEKGKQFSGMVDACYEIKSMGRQADFFNSRSCSEWWQNGLLESVSCQKHTPQLYFHPDGSFIRYPWHTNISKSAEEKDSLVLSVGTCSTVR